MQVIEFLNNNFIVDHFFTLGLLEEFGIKFNHDETYNLFVLNYDQIKSAKHKFHPIVLECRSLVIDFKNDRFNVVSRSFDRFFNHGESQQEYSCGSLTAHEKLDGSLIGIFQYEGVWLYRTKSMIMPVSEINGLDVTWNEIIDPLLPSDVFMNYLSNYLGLVDDTIICELVAPHNRVVVRYDEPALRLLAIRGIGGEFSGVDYCDLIADRLNMSRPRTYTFDSYEEALEAAKELPNLEEGFVFYNEEDVPVLKMKNPAYVAAHHLRGEGVLNAKRVCDLLIMNEMDEYLSVFPEDDQIIAPYVLGFKKMNDSILLHWNMYSRSSDQKEFAMKVKGLIDAPVLFSMKKGLTYEQAWDRLTTPAKRNMILKYTKEGDL